MQPAAIKKFLEEMNTSQRRGPRGDGTKQNVEENSGKMVS